jgi:PEP-CTERM motif
MTFESTQGMGAPWTIALRRRAKSDRLSVVASAALLGLAVPLALALPAEASAVLPDAVFSSGAFYGNSAGPPFNINVSNTITTTGTASVDNGAYASIMNLPNPTLTAQAYGAVLGPFFGYFGQSGSDLRYSAEILGPEAFIPIDISYSGTTANTNALSTAYVALFAGGFPDGLSAGGTVFRSDLDPSSTFSGSVSTEVSAGSVFGIELSAGTETGEDNGDSGYIQLDPIISIDPSFALIDPTYQNDYSIILSRGIGNAPDDVPEPVTWTLMLFGFGGIGAAVRRRRCATIAS